MPSSDQQFPRLAWRVFTLDSGVLVAPFMERYLPLAEEVHRWEDGAQTALCGVESHAAPDEGCTCGLRGVVKPAELLKSVEASFLDDERTILDACGVIAKVELSGRILPGIDGDDPPTTLRAERAAVVELHLAPAIDSTLAQQVANRYMAARTFAYAIGTWPGRLGAGDRIWPEATKEGRAKFIGAVRAAGFGRKDRGDKGYNAAMLEVGNAVCKALRSDANAEDLAAVLFRGEAAPTMKQVQTLIFSAVENLSPGLVLAPKPYRTEAPLNPFEVAGRSFASRL